MNPLVLETAIKSALENSAFSSGSILCGTSYQVQTPESINIIVAARSTDHPAANIYRATIDVEVVSPALMGGSDEADSYAAMQSAIDTLQSSMTNTYLTANWPDSSAASFLGIFHQDTKMSQHGEDWNAVISFVMGVSFDS